MEGCRDGRFFGFGRFLDLVNWYFDGLALRPELYGGCCCIFIENNWGFGLTVWFWSDLLNWFILIEVNGGQFILEGGCLLLCG